MIGGVMRAWENLLGTGEAAVTVPPLDGALRPNRKLDEADWRVPLADVDCLAIVSGALLASSGNAIHILDGETWRVRSRYEAEVAGLAALGGDALAVALVNGDILIEGGRLDGRRHRAAPEARCITDMTAKGAALFVANGSATNSADAWQLDLLQRNASGSIWRIDLETGAKTRILDGLAFPAGIALDGDTLVCAEAWKHRLIRIDPAGGEPRTILSDLPGYPGRIAPAADGHWLAVFAPRTQIVEFVLREPAYRRRMIAEVPRPYWIAPKLRAGRSFYEPLQGGSVKHLGLLKPWAPTMSAGLCIKLDGAFQPRLSLHSRADGATHGVTSVIEHGGRVVAAARGDGVVVAVPLANLEEPE
ncbi:MAG TPA: hypothetical protein VFK86_00915 [Bauldia sp.]|nr:hypothetical protein [Bauldia sp.]